MAAFIHNDIPAAGLIVLGDGYLEEGQTPRSLTGVVSPKAVIVIT